MTSLCSNCKVVAGYGTEISYRPQRRRQESSAPEFLRDAVGIRSFVNADVIAEGLSGFRPQDAAFEAGRIMLARARELAARRADDGSGRVS
jgi:hypothetical protein